MLLSYFLIFGSDHRIGATILLIFLIPTTIIFHLFPFQSQAFYMNLGLIGGLLLVFSVRPPIQMSPPESIYFPKRELRTQSTPQYSSFSLSLS